MKVKVTNNRQAAYGVEIASGGYRFIRPGEEKTIDAANVAGLEAAPGIEVEIVSGLKPPPASLKAKAAQVGETFTGFLDRSIAAISEDLPSLDAAELSRHLGDEKKGKSRKGLIAAIEAEIDARAP